MASNQPKVTLLTLNKTLARQEIRQANISPANLRMGCTILKYYMDMEKNDLIKALARYNGSTGQRVYSDKVLDVLRTRWRRK